MRVVVVRERVESGRGCHQAEVLVQAEPFRHLRADGRVDRSRVDQGGEQVRELPRGPHGHVRRVVGTAPVAEPVRPDLYRVVADLGYEEARQQLVDLVARLEGGQVGLEESMELWQRGEALAAHCEAWLDRAEANLSQGTEDPSSTNSSASATDG